MLRKTMLASLAAGALAVTAPAATADEPAFGCRFQSLAEQTQTSGGGYEGEVVGYVVHPEGGHVEITCYVSVDGVYVAGTGTGTGELGVATTATAAPSHVRFELADPDTVALCARVVTTHGAFDSCVGAERYQIPPQEVIDLVSSALSQVDPTVCPLLAAHAGTYGPVVVNDQGDVFVDGTPEWDCPPYDLFG